MTYEENILSIANNVLSIEDNQDKINYLLQELENSPVELIEPIQEYIICLSN